MRRGRRGRRGFTILELVMVVAVIGLMAAATVPSLARSRQRTRLGTVLRGLMSDVVATRAIAVGSGRTTAGTTRYRNALIRVESGTRYAIYADTDTVTNGNETLIKVVDLTASDRATSLSITSPAIGSEVRLASNGTRTRASASMFEVTDARTNVRAWVDVAGTGTARVRY